MPVLSSSRAATLFGIRGFAEPEPCAGRSVRRLRAAFGAEVSFVDKIFSTIKFTTRSFSTNSRSYGFLRYQLRGILPGGLSAAGFPVRLREPLTSASHQMGIYHVYNTDTPPLYTFYIYIFLLHGTLHAGGVMIFRCCSASRSATAWRVRVPNDRDRGIRTERIVRFRQASISMGL